MTDTAIRVDNLSKKYILGNTSSGSLRETVVNIFRANYKAKTEEFWALKDISFEVKQGEAIGIIGKNGAGKSTLLKILSRITEPTRGKVEIDGRVSSLLEVGTGFHPELTGRENVFLNGTILGMKRQEIKAKFDEIVEFSGVEKFLDTPVKRYSSGMKVRLAFAVAAHLEPEILVIDEVLAVGDAEFQRKCLGKMEDVAGQGRTVLFVSHNMQAVRSLCNTGLLLVNGRVQTMNNVDTVVDQYLKINQSAMSNSGVVEWADWEHAPGGEEIKLRSIKLLDSDGDIATTFDTSNPIGIEIQYIIRKPVKGARIIFQLLDNDENIIFASTNQNEEANNFSSGEYKTTCVIPANILNGGIYKVKIHIGIPGVKVLVQGKPFLEFNTVLMGNNGSFYKDKWPGVVAPKLNWKTTQLGVKAN